MSTQPRFMLIHGYNKFLNSTPRWVIVSSSNKAMTLPVTHVDYLDSMIRHGSVRPNNFGHDEWTTPERELLMFSKVKPTEHHGYFRTLRDVRDYIRTIKLLG